MGETGGRLGVKMWRRDGPSRDKDENKNKNDGNNDNIK